MSDFSLLPEEVLQQIFFLVPATDLIRHCSLVCTRWRDIINSPTLWKIKCRDMGYISKECRQTPKDWKQFYYLSSKKRNLIRNPCAMDDFDFWSTEQDVENRWDIRDFEGELKPDFPEQAVTRCFVTSYWPCNKSQLINLKEMGYGENLLDVVQPDIVIRDWFAAGQENECEYEILVQLLSENREPIKVFNPALVTMEWNDPQWYQMKHTFSNYGPGVRYIYFQHGGQPTKFSAGFYGVYLTSSSITIEPEDLRD